MSNLVYGKKLNRNTNQRKALYRSLAVSLFTHGGINTTVAKAKAVRPLVEKMVTVSKAGELNARRTLLSRLPNQEVVEKLLTSIGPTFANRPGGYTRIVKLGFRHGDNAPMARLELVEELKAPLAKKLGKYQAKNVAKKERAKAAAKPVKETKPNARRTVKTVKKEEVK